MEPGKKRLFIFSFKAVLFCALLAGIIALFADYVPKNRSEKMDMSMEHLLKTKDSVDYDIFFFSNSYIYSSIDPLYLEHLTGLKSLMFCGPAQRIIFTIKTIKNVLKYYKPKCIVVDLSMSSTVMPKDRKDWSFNAESLLSSDISFPDMLRLLMIIPEKEKMNVFLDGYSAYTASLNNLSRWKEYKKPLKDRHVEAYLGFVPLRKQSDEISSISQEEFNKTYHRTKVKTGSLFDKPSREAFFSFFKEFSNRGIKVIFISTIKPDSRYEEGFDRVADSIRHLSPGNYFTINLNDPDVKDTLALTRDDFADKGHPTYRGAIRITEYLAQVFKQAIRTDPADRNHSQITFPGSGIIISDYKLVLEDYFMKVVQLYFDSIPEDCKDSGLVISIIPEDLYFAQMSDKMKEKAIGLNTEYLTRDDFIETRDGSYVVSVFLRTKYPKEKINRIEIGLSGESKKETSGITLYARKN